MTPEEILASRFCPRLIEAMKARLLQGHHKYGPMTLEARMNTDYLANVKLRIAKYEETGNTEWLVDAANYLMFEFRWPSHPDAHFRATPTEESPGVKMANGRTVKGGENYRRACGND